MANRIALSGELVLIEEPAAGAITPGMLLLMDATGDLVAHSAAGDLAEKMFALEDSLQGNTIDDDYAADDLVRAGIFEPGAVVLALLADGESTAIGDFLMSDGAGALAVDDGSTYERGAAVAVALEAVDMSDSSTVDPSPRIRVRIL